MIHEVNNQPPDVCVAVQKPDSFKYWDGSDYKGASVCAFHCLAKLKKYTMVYCESKGLNCFLVRNDLIRTHLKVMPELAQETLSPKFLYKDSGAKYPAHKEEKNSWQQITCN